MRPQFKHSLAAVLGMAGLLLAAAAQAGTTDLADKPLVNATTAVILPNIMLDLDNSGSMVWDYMPDYVRFRSDNVFETWCRDTTGGQKAVCEQGDPPYAASAFNKLYYNPAVRYQWPVDPDGKLRADGSGKTSYAKPWNAVPSDGYNVQWIDALTKEAGDPLTKDWEPCRSKISGGNCPRSSPNATTDLAAAFPERRWCNYLGACKPAVENGAYSYPNASYNQLKVVYGAPYYYNVKVDWCNTQGKCQSRKTAKYSNLSFGTWTRVDIKDGMSYPKAAGRTDCAGTSCTYAEEMNNFAIWYAWYRSRSQMAKSSIGHAFVDVRGTPNTDPDDPKFFHARIGLTTIDKSTINLSIQPFDSDQKTKFFSKLYASVPSSGTPLRDALNEVGQMYMGKSKIYKDDPVKYACQRNFAILTTDGYWNGADSGLGDQDSDLSVSRPSYAPNGGSKEGTLADVAYYYYHTDLRPDMENIVPGAGSNPNVDDVATHQHMTTFTLGLGVDGTLAYQPDYKTAKSGDYFDIVQGTKDWPVPGANKQEAIDDLWHAAVSGRGTYFSAQDPVALADGLRKALGSIEQADGSGAAAATSNLEPTDGDNYIYIANYRTQLWDGELSAYTFDTGTGEINAKPVWQASTLLSAMIDDTKGTDSRTIWTSDDKNNLVPFKILANGKGVNPAFFNNSLLSQSKDWAPEQTSAATAATLVDYLRGNDPKAKIGTSSVRLYRERSKILGDVVHSQPVYVKQPQHDFKDAGYAAFKAKERDGMVYAGANDGMLHAFDAATGAERWAYIPPMVLPDLWRLADTNYGDRHRFYLDGPLAVSDANVGGWKTILIGAMGKGGRGYYALDVTNPAAPNVMWTFTADNDARLGYTYGTPVITKLNGKWVALVASGYNNVPEGTKYSQADGKGRLFVLDLATGTVDKSISTGVGAQDDPSGLARINIRVSDFASDDSAIAAYGGDLKGNLWRFDLENNTAKAMLQLGDGMPITVAPAVSTVELSPTESYRSVYIATGRYLGVSDLTPKIGNDGLPVKESKQAIIGLLDDEARDTVKYPGTLQEQSLTTAGNVRTSTKTKVNWKEQGGWYVELPDDGERVTISPQLYFGTVLVSSLVPTSSACQPGGFSWLYQLDYASGGFVNKNKPVGTMQPSPMVGLTVSKLPNGTPIIHGVTADGKRPKVNKLDVGTPDDVDDKHRRLLWRELGI